MLDEADRMLNQDSFHNDIMDLVHSPGFPSVILYEEFIEKIYSKLQNLLEKLMQGEQVIRLIRAGYVSAH